MTKNIRRFIVMNLHSKLCIKCIFGTGLVVAKSKSCCRGQTTTPVAILSVLLQEILIYALSSYKYVMLNGDPPLALPFCSCVALYFIFTTTPVAQCRWTLFFTMKTSLVYCDLSFILSHGLLSCRA